MHSPDDRPLSAADQAYAIARAKQLVAASRDPKSKLLLARQIFDDAFSDKAPEKDAVMTRAGQPMKGHARRDTVPSIPAPPMHSANEADTAAEYERYAKECTERSAVIAENERKLRALLWARDVFLSAGDPEGFGEALESAVREWFLCTLPELPRDRAGIEKCVKANACASWSLLRRIAQDRMRDAAE